MPSLNGSLKIAPILISGLVSATSYYTAVVYSPGSHTLHSNVLFPPSLSDSSSARSDVSGSATGPSNVFSVFTGRMISGPTSGTRSEAK